MTWLAKSIMHTRGVAGGKVGQTHKLSKHHQGEFQYTIGPYSNPVLQIEPGDRIIVETVDTFGGAIRTEVDLPTQKLRAPFLNPQSGPILVGGATKGDVLAVYIESIVPRGQNPRGIETNLAIQANGRAEACASRNRCRSGTPLSDASVAGRRCRKR